MDIIRKIEGHFINLSIIIQKHDYLIIVMSKKKCIIIDIFLDNNKLRKNKVLFMQSCSVK